MTLVAVAHPHVQQAVPVSLVVVLDVAEQRAVAASRGPGRSRIHGGRPFSRRRRAARPWSACRSRCPAPARPARTPPAARAGVNSVGHRLRAAGEDDALGLEGRGSPRPPCRRDGSRSRRRSRAPGGRSAGCTGSRSRGSGSVGVDVGVGVQGGSVFGGPDTKACGVGAISSRRPAASITLLAMTG
jgi:hypothetical protein